MLTTHGVAVPNSLTFQNPIGPLASGHHLGASYPNWLLPRLSFSVNSAKFLLPTLTASLCGWGLLDLLHLSACPEMRQNGCLSILSSKKTHKALVCCHVGSVLSRLKSYSEYLCHKLFHSGSTVVFQLSPLPLLDAMSQRTSIHDPLASKGQSLC